MSNKNGQQPSEEIQLVLTKAEAGLVLDAVGANFTINQGGPLYNKISVQLSKQTENGKEERSEETETEEVR